MAELEAPNVVTGTRVALAKRLDIDAIFSLGGIPLLLVAAWWFASMVRDYGHNWDAEHFAPTLLGTLFFSVVGFIGLAFASEIPSYLRWMVLDSACPCCRVRRQRNFRDPTNPDESPVECGACIAYLRAKGLDVREEQAHAIELRFPPYAIAPARYLRAAKLDTHHRFHFEMPPICAVCGAADAPEQRKIKDWYVEPGSGILGDVASFALSEAIGTSTLHHATSSGPPPPTTSEQRDQQLSHLQVPVCAAHAKDDGGYPISFHAGNLEFASYRYYKAFLAHNHIDGAP